MYITIFLTYHKFKLNFPSNIDLINSSYTSHKSCKHISNSKYETVLEIDHFEPALGKFNPTSQQQQQPSPRTTNLPQHNDTTSTSNGTNSSLNLTPTISNDTNFHLSATTSLPQELTTQSSTDKMRLLRKAKLIETNREFKSFMYVYPKMLKYDQQKVFSKARNIMIKAEFKERDVLGDEILNNLNVIYYI